MIILQRLATLQVSVQDTYSMHRLCTEAAESYMNEKHDITYNGVVQLRYGS